MAVGTILDWKLFRANTGNSGNEPHFVQGVPPPARMRIARILAGGGTSRTERCPFPEFPVFARNNFQSRIVPTAIANFYMAASPKRNICFWHSAGLDFRGLLTREGIMQTTRRTFLGAVGATAALGVAGGARIPEALVAEPSEIGRASCRERV